MKSDFVGLWTDLISPKPKGFDFIQTLFGFHRAERHDCIKKVNYMTENKLADLSIDFAVEIVKTCKTIKEDKKESII